MMKLMRFRPSMRPVWPRPDGAFFAALVAHLIALAAMAALLHIFWLWQA